MTTASDLDAAVFCWMGVFGGVEGDRTLDLRIANAALSQLSYHPESRVQL